MYIYCISILIHDLKGTDVKCDPWIRFSNSLFVLFNCKGCVSPRDIFNLRALFSFGSLRRRSHFSLPLLLLTFPAWLLRLVLSCLYLRDSLRTALRTKIMDLISWSLNAIDTIFSTRNSGSGEPDCPAGTFAAGYSRDAWETWRVVCLAALSVEDIEDIYLFGTVITGFLLIGLGAALVYRKLKEMVTAVKSPLKLPMMIDALGRAVGTQNADFNRQMVNITEKLTALQRKLDRFGDRWEKLEKLEKVEKE